MKLLFIVITLLSVQFAYSQDDEFAEFDEVESSTESSYSWSFNGFVEVEQGSNISGVGAQENHPHGVNYVMANRKLRVQANRPFEKGSFYSKLDYNYDESTYKHELDLRELRIQYQVLNWLDLSVGRQVSTWGVGDMLFINDLFPKNWLANFQGQEMELLKDPSNSLRLTSYIDDYTLDVVYQPEFTADNTPTGCRFGVFNPNTSTVIANRDACEDSKALDKFGNEVDDDEIAISLKKKIKNHEVALYFYDGYYKSPKGLLSGTSLVGYHPKLNVFGVSDEGQLGPGIISFEAGYYDSKEDPKGTSSLIENSKIKYLLGYRMDLTANFSAGAQFYQEKMLNYSEYENAVRASNPNSFAFRKKEYQNTITTRLTYKMMQETLYLSLFTYLRPQDKDSFTKFEVSKKVTDNLKITTGVNIFTGSDNYRDREFGMLRDDDNAFLRINYSF